MTEPSIFGINFSPLSLDDIADKLVRVSPEEDSITLFTANLDHIVKMRKNIAFRSAYSRASIVTADGFPVYFYARCRGLLLPGRVTGADLFPVLIARLSPERHRPFFVVSDEETAERIDNALVEIGFENIETIVPPFGFETDLDYSKKLAEKISVSHPTHLFLCVGAPKSEIWLDRYLEIIGPCHALALGMGANFFARTAQRAPLWVQKIGGEWLWRFMQEPRRLFRRYFVDSWSFFLAIADDLKRKKL